MGYPGSLLAFSDLSPTNHIATETDEASVGDLYDARADHRARVRACKYVYVGRGGVGCQSHRKMSINRIF